MRPALALGVATVAAVVAFQLWITPSNPPGFHRDEAALSYNAYTLSTSLRDEDGARLPLFFRSFGDYKSPVYPYVLAAVFRITGPNKEVARGLSAVLVVVAILLLGVLAWNLTGSGLVTVAIVVLAGLTPWLFEIGRVALEVSTQPLLVTALLLALLHAWRRGAWTVPGGIGVGAIVGLLTYSYTGNRLLAPLLAGALVVFAGRERWRWLIAAWVTFAVFLVPLAVYGLRHPGTLTARYTATSITRDYSGLRLVGQAIANWWHDFNPWHWATAGDPAPYIHNGGYGAFFAAVMVLTVAGIVIVLRRRRDDLWWRYVLLATIVAPIPAALTVDRYNAIRLAALPVLFLVLAIPALEALVELAQRGWLWRIAIAGLAVSAAAQFMQFLDSYTTRGPARVVLFEEGVAPLLDQAFADADRIYIDHDDRGAQIQAKWRAAVRGFSRDRVQVLPDGGVPPAGSTIFGFLQPCDYECREFARWDRYWLARAAGPIGG
jgi:Dolichyl-phosphate-mannose-protein mannosyltransferase